MASKKKAKKNRTLKAKLHKLKGEELTPITIRLDSNDLEFLDSIEAATGIKYYEYIRALIKALRDEFSRGQKIELPFRIVKAEPVQAEPVQAPPVEARRLPRRAARRPGRPPKLRRPPQRSPGRPGAL